MLKCSDLEHRSRSAAFLGPCVCVEHLDRTMSFCPLMQTPAGFSGLLVGRARWRAQRVPSCPLSFWFIFISHSASPKCLFCFLAFFYAPHPGLEKLDFYWYMSGLWNAIRCGGGPALYKQEEKCTNRDHGVKYVMKSIAEIGCIYSPVKTGGSGRSRF